MDVDLSTIDTELDALFTTDPSALSSEEVRDTLHLAERIRTRIEALNADLLGVMHTTKAHRGDGAHSPANWLCQSTGTAKNTAQHRAKLAEKLLSMPMAARLFREGSITIDHVRILARTLTNPRTRDQLDGLEEFRLAGQALFDTADQYATRIAHWIDRHDPDGASPDDPTTDRTYADQVGDRVKINADLSLETGLPILAALEEATDKVFHADQAHAEAHACSDRDVRPRSNRRSQALAELISAGAAAPDNTTRREPAFVVIQHGDGGGNGGCPRYETPDGTVIPHRLAAKWATSALALRLVLSDNGRSQFRTPDGVVAADLDRGRSARLVNRAQRRALHVRDRHCAFPGCHRPAAWTDAHHVQWWRHQGPTDMANLALLCRHHHGAVHAGRYDLTMGPGQTPIFTDAATGERVVPRRHRPPPDSTERRAA